MSYARMDHAAWVEQNNAAARRRYKKPRYSKGGRKIGFHGAPEKLTEFQCRVMDVLGMALGGIYNAPISWTTVDWDNGYGFDCVSVNLSPQRGLATWDFNRLTMLVFLCHEARIRLEILPAGWSLRLTMWPRTDDGPIAKRHPNLDEAVAAFRAYLPADHRIIYRAPEKEKAA